MAVSQSLARRTSLSFMKCLARQPPCLGEPPQLRLALHPVVQFLDVPVSQEVEELSVSKIMGAFPSADTEQVIEVPKILDNFMPQRAVPMAPQMAEKLCGNSVTTFSDPPPLLLLNLLFRRWKTSWWKLWENGRRSVDVFRQLAG